MNDINIAHKFTYGKGYGNILGVCGFWDPRLSVFSHEGQGGGEGEGKGSQVRGGEGKIED